MEKRIPLALVLAAVSILACSSKSNPATQPCNENPWECPSGQTCWPTLSGSFECVNSGPGAAGSSCQDSAGVATCGDGLACLATTATNGVCTPYCDNTNPAHACPAGLVCDMIQVLVSGAGQYQACGGGAASTDAGNSGGSDAGAGDGSSTGAVDSGATPTTDSGAADSGAASTTDSGAADVTDGAIVVDSGIVI
jgi:hypothetical protein